MTSRLLLQRSLVGLGVAVVLGTAACGSGSSHSSKTAPKGGGVSLTIKSFKYEPNPLQAKVGDTITVSNQDNTDHTVTADDHSFDTGRFSSGTKTFRVTHAGTITYHCDVHNFMTGTIQVSGA